MRVIRTLTLAFSFVVCSFVVCSLLAFSAAQAQGTVGITIDVEPPPLPVYDQPPIPEPGYMWTPGYWAWDDDTGYYWVPGTWVLPPEPELLWTPGYWGWKRLCLSRRLLGSGSRLLRRRILWLRL
jgi:WXXGXW repeat (2 copies)